MSESERHHAAIAAAGRIVRAALPDDDEYGLEAAMRHHDAARDQALQELAAGVDPTLLAAELASLLAEDLRYYDTISAEGQSPLSALEGMLQAAHDEADLRYGNDTTTEQD